MNFIEQIEGLRGENLTSAVLKYLMINSQIFRETIVDLISIQSHLGPISIASHFSCYLEDPTKDINRNSGRLDLVLETDQAIIGIENKIHADFQEGQPHKYLESMKEKSKALNNLRGVNYSHLVVVLAPKYREQETNTKIAGENHLMFISWEDLMDSLSAVVEKERYKIDNRTMMVFSELDGFLKEKIEFMPNFEKYYLHITKQYIPGGSEYQNMLVDKISEFFPDIKRRGTGRLHFGYGFYDGDGWYGIMKGSEVGLDDPSSAALIIVTKNQKPALSESFKALKNNVPWKNWGYKFGWLINFDQSWGDIEKWKKELAPLMDE